LNVYRPTWVEINPKIFRRNVQIMMEKMSSSVGVLVVLKADGYGHGAVPLARAVADLPVWGFGVSSVEEGLRLRRSGVRQRILILGSLFPFESFRVALRHNLTPTIASDVAALALSREAARLGAMPRGRSVPVHLKVDTGMGRIGMSPKTVVQMAAHMSQIKNLRLKGVYTHLAQGELARPTAAQLKIFDGVLGALKGLFPKIVVHAANSAAAISFPKSRYNLVRPGLALYGVQSSAGGLFPSMEPVLSWKSRVVFLKTVPKGTAVSYGATFRTTRTSRLATLPVGYADGYRGALSNRAQVLVKGRRCPVVGRVTMDQIIVDVTDVPRVDVGEEIVLIGAQRKARISVEDMAKWAGVLPYEILTGITARVPRTAIFCR
jgi:alanine racemase